MEKTYPDSLARSILLVGILLCLGLVPQVSPAVVRGRAAALAGDPALAAQELGRAARQLPWRTDLWLLAGRNAAQAGQIDTALQYYTQAIQSSPGSLAGSALFGSQDWLSLGEAYLQHGDLAHAIQAWQIAAQTFGPSPVTSQRLYQAYLAQGDVSAAIDELETLVSLNPQEAQYPYQLGLLLAASQPERALEVLQQAAQLDPSLQRNFEAIRRSILSARRSEDPAYTLVVIGRSLAALDEWELAAQAFLQAVTLRPDYAEAWAFLGEARQQVAQRTPVPAGATAPEQDGLSELQTALKLDPNSLAANALLALYWTRQGRPELALPAMQLTAALDSHNPTWQVALAGLLAQQGDLDTAYRLLLQAAELSPYDPSPLYHLINFSLSYGYRVKEVALPAARQALLLAPQSAAGLTWYGQVLFYTGDLASAERFFQRALSSQPDYAPAHLGLGSVYLFNGDQSAALAEFRTAYSLDPTAPTAEQAQRLVETYLPGTVFP